MKKIILLFFILFGYNQLFCQLEWGDMAPDWTLQEIPEDCLIPNPNDPQPQIWTLWDELNNGKHVIIDFSSVWCAPCWRYHESGILDNLWNVYGPDGYNTLRVFFIEADEHTNMECLCNLPECNYPNQGNWQAETPYPIFSPTGSECTTIIDDYKVESFPTLYAINAYHKTAWQLVHGASPESPSIETWENWINKSFSMEIGYSIEQTECSSTIDLSVDGGYNQLSYQWSNGAISEDISGQLNGTYTVTVTDENGYFLIQEITINASYDDCPCGDINVDLSSEGIHNVDDMLQAMNLNNLDELCNSTEKYRIVLGGNLILDSGSGESVCFGNGTTFKMLENAKITVSNNTTLEFDNVHVFACDVFWEHIYIESGSTINISNNTLIENGRKAIEAEKGATVSIDNTIFNNNEIGLKLIDIGAGNRTNVDISGSTFTSDNDYGSLLMNRPKAGIVIEGQYYVNLRTTQGSENTFRKLENGILVNNGSVNVTYSVFEDIYENGLPLFDPDDIELMLEQDGYAIKLLNNTSASRIMHNSIADVRYGIGQSKGMLVAKDNIFKEVDDAILGYDLYAIRAYENNIEVYERGIFIAFSHLHFLHKFIRDNYITGIGHEKCLGILITKSSPILIDNNRIYLGDNNAGIYLGNSRFNTVEYNTIEISGTSSSIQTEGIYLESNEQDVNEVLYNLINQNGSDLNNSGIYDNESYGNRFRCNEINDFYTGMQFWGACHESKLKGNTYNDNTFDLVLGKEYALGDPNGATYIGRQADITVNPHEGWGNLWPTPNCIAHNSAPTFTVKKSKFYVNADPDLNPDYIPEYIEAEGTWFENSPEITNDSSCIGSVPGSNLPPLCDELINEIVQIDTMSIMDDCVKLMWQYKYYTQLMELKKKGLLSDACIAFLNSQGSNELVQIAEAVSAMDSLGVLSVEAVLLFNELYNITITLDSLYDIGNYGSEEWNQTITIYDQTITEYQTVLEEDRTREVVRNDSIKNVITTITVTDSCLQILLDVYTIQLNLLKNDSLSSSEITFLQPIAASCSSDLGYGVFIARSMMSLYENVRYPRMEECYSDSMEPRNSTITKVRSEKLKIYPNPATNKVNILLDLDKYETGTIEILNINYNILRVFDIGNSKNSFDINTSSYTSGVYFVKYISDTGEQKIKKLLIVK